MSAALNVNRAIKMGYSADKRKRRRQHRQAARQLMGAGTLLNSKTPRNSTPVWSLAGTLPKRAPSEGDTHGCQHHFRRFPNPR